MAKEGMKSNNTTKVKNIGRESIIKEKTTNYELNKVVK